MTNSFFTSESIQLGPWSNSSLGTLEQCPYKFDLQYVQKLRERDIPEELRVEKDDSALRYGVGVHKLSELVSTGTPVEAALSKTAKEQKLTVVEKKQLAAAKNSILTFESRLKAFKSAYNMTTDLTEIDLAVDADLKKSGFFDPTTVLRGKVDRLLISGDGTTAVVIDLKTGKKATLDYARDQLEFYATLVLGSYPEVNIVRSALYFTRLDTMLWDSARKRGEYSMGQDNSIVAKINTMSAEFAASEPSEIKVQNLCKWCTYKEVCKKERAARRSTDRKTR